MSRQARSCGPTWCSGPRTPSGGEAAIVVDDAAGHWPADDFAVTEVLRQGLRLTAIGLGIGLLGSLALTRGLSSQLYEVSPADPITFVAVSLLLLAIALLACYFPARRATKIDPMVALRCE